jgi:hypothetical protein
LFVLRSMTRKLSVSLCVFSCAIPITDNKPVMRGHIYWFVYMSIQFEDPFRFRICNIEMKFLKKNQKGLGCRKGRAVEFAAHIYHGSIPAWREVKSHKRRWRRVCSIRSPCRRLTSSWRTVGRRSVDHIRYYEMCDTFLSPCKLW